MPDFGHIEKFFATMFQNRNLQKHLSCSKANLDRVAQQINLVRAPFLIHCALNNDERANSSRFPFTNGNWRVRGRLTLMLAAAANATATPAPGRHHWFMKGFLRRPFRYPAHASGVAGH